MTLKQAIRACKHHGFEVKFDDVLGSIGIYKHGRAWSGPEDTGGYGPFQLHRLALEDSFVRAVRRAIENLGIVDFREE